MISHDCPIASKVYLAIWVKSAAFRVRQSSNHMHHSWDVLYFIQRNPAAHSQLTYSVIFLLTAIAVYRKLNVKIALRLSSICIMFSTCAVTHDDVTKWKKFPRYWLFVRGIHRSLVYSPLKGQWRGALMFLLICAWTNGWANSRGADDFRRHRAHYDVPVIQCVCIAYIWSRLLIDWES